MKNKELKLMMNGAVLLSVAGLFSKILSAVYRVPFQNMVGNTGFYVYQQVYPIYGIGMTFALAGFPVFFSKTIAEAKTPNERKKLVWYSLLILSLFSFVLFGLTYGFANQIAFYMGDLQLTPLIQSVSWMFLFMPILASFRGYFQGTYRMQPTAHSQVAEQLVRVLVILYAAWIYASTGTDIYVMGTQAMSGAIWGAAIATGILLFAMRKEKFLFNKDSTTDGLTLLDLAKRYATEGLTICLLTSILVLFQLIDSFTLYKGLIENGIDPLKAKSLKGIYDRGQPLVQLGMVVGTGFSAGFIPVMSQAIAYEKMEEFHRAARSLIRMTASFSFVAVAGLLAILPEVNRMLFGDTSGNTVLSIYIVAIATTSIVLTFHSILQSFNRYLLTLIALALGLSVKLLTNLLLVPLWNTVGASLATVVGLIAMGLFLFRYLPLELRAIWIKDHFLFKLMNGAAIVFTSAYATKLILALFISNSRSGASIIAILTMLVGVIVFISYILKVQLFTAREWLAIPFGKKLLKKFAINQKQKEKK